MNEILHPTWRNCRKCPDKSQYTLFNPTPANCLREFDPDRPDVTDSPFTVDAGHIQFESGLLSYSLSRPDRQGLVTEEFDILDTNMRLGITNYAEIDLDVPPLDVEHKRFPVSRFDTWKSGPGPFELQAKFNFGNDNFEKPGRPQEAPSVPSVSSPEQQQQAPTREPTLN